MNATIPAVGLSVELHRAFEVGASFGVAYFTTTVRNEDYKRDQRCCDASFRLQAAARLWEVEGQPTSGISADALAAHGEIGKVDGASFGAPAGTFSSGTEVLVKSGSYVVFDVFEALRGR